MSSSASELIQEFLSDFRTDLLPIYVGLAGVVTWLGVLTVIVLTEAGVPAAETERFMNLTGLLALTFGVVLPFGSPVVSMLARRV